MLPGIDNLATRSDRVLQTLDVVLHVEQLRKDLADGFLLVKLNTEISGSIPDPLARSS